MRLGVGVGIALDDFGCGYANLQQLYRFRPEQIKIDRSFISKLGWTRIVR